MRGLQVERLTLLGVRCFGEEIACAFATDGLTVVHGPNEAGKTTLLSGVGAVLFGVDTADLPHWRTDPQRNTCRGSLAFLCDGRRLVIERDFLTHETRVVGDDGAVLFEGEANPKGARTPAKQYRACLEEWLGFASRDTFQQSAYLQLAHADDALKYDETIRAMLSGAGAADFHDVEKHLIAAYEELTQETPWGKRKTKRREIEELRDQLSKFRDTLRHAESAAERAQVATTARNQAQAELESARRAEEEARGAQDRLREIQAVAKDLATAKADADRALQDQHRARDLDRDIQQLEERLRRDFAAVADVRREDIVLLERAETAKAEADRFSAEAQSMSEPEAPETPSPFPAVALAVGGMLLGAVVATFNAWVALGVLLLAVVVAGLLLRQSRRQEAALSTAYERERTEWESRQQRAAAAAQAMRAAEVDRPARLAQYTAAELEARVGARDELRYQLTALRQAREAFPDLEVLDQRVRDATIAVGAAEARLEGLGAVGADPHETGVALQRAKDDESRARERAAVAQRHLSDAQRELAQAESVAFPPLAQLLEDIGDGEDRLTALENRRDALRVAVEVLREAARDFQSDHVAEITERATALLTRFTREGWTVQLASNTLAPRITWRQRDWPLPRLSAGTRDQLAVALRLAVVRALRGNVALPVILDDPMAHWDAERRRAFRHVLTDLAQSHQVILATPDPAVAAWGSAQVTLSG